MTTVHANSPGDAFSRLETMVMMAKLDLPSRFIRQQMASVITIVVQTSRMSDGSRKITHVAEVLGLSDLDILVQDIFVFERTGVDANGRVLGQFRGTGIVPRCMERLRLAGIHVPPEIFEKVTPVQ